MKCKQLALRVLSTAAILSIVTSCAAPAFAGTYNLAYGDISISSKKDSGTGKNSTTVKYHEEKDGAEKSTEDNEKIEIVSKEKDESGEMKDVSTKNTVKIDVDKDAKADVTFDNVTIETNKGVTSSNSNKGYKDDNGITVKNEGEANITLKDTKVDTKNQPTNSSSAADGGAGMAVSGKGDTTIKLEGDNQFKSGDNHAGIEKNDDDAKDGTLTITTDTKKTEEDTEQKQPTLEATGGYGSAGIGGGNGQGTSNITIKGNVNITATGDSTGNRYASGIGGGMYGRADNICIEKEDDDNQPTINAKGSTGIGGGYGKNASITIKGGNITAVGNLGAAIGGGGYYSEPDAPADKTTVNTTVNISDATINATITNDGGYNGTATGIGGVSGNTTITITDSNIKGETPGIGAGKGSLNLTIGGKTTIEKLTKWLGLYYINRNTTSFITIKDQTKIGSATIIGAEGSDTNGKLNIKIQDDATIDQVGEYQSTNNQHPAIGIAGKGNADITIGGSSTDQPQEGSVTIGDAFSDYRTVIGSDNSGKVEVKGNVDLTVHSKSYDSSKTWLKGSDGKEMDTVSLIKNGVLSAISKIVYGDTESVNKIVHGSAVCKSENIPANWKKGTAASDYKAPTCTEEGYQNYYCNVDHNSCVSSSKGTGVETVTLAKIPHAYELIEDVAPTCTTEGHKTYRCKNCDASYTDTTEALGHDMTDWTIVEHPTFEKDGLEERHCTRGDVTETRPIPKLAHRWIDNGDGTETCEDCGVTEDIPGYVPPEQPAEPTTPDTPAEEPTTPDQPGLYTENDESSPWLYVTDLSGLRILFDETQSGDTYTATAADRDDAVLTGSFDALDELADDGVENIVFVTHDHTSTVSLQALRGCSGGSFELTHIGDSAVLTVDGKPVSGLLG